MIVPCWLCIQCVFPLPCCKFQRFEFNFLSSTTFVFFNSFSFSKYRPIKNFLILWCILRFLIVVTLTLILVVLSGNLRNWDSYSPLSFLRKGILSFVMDVWNPPVLGWQVAYLHSDTIICNPLLLISIDIFIQRIYCYTLDTEPLVLYEIHKRCSIFNVS